ncbi:hydantoinase/carbamoylase family amidase [Comamonas antarctica]|uniref:Hydantoinase/carbamoylase family amidase n=1 Tax=Comamonas antarctica TaxID=2743470 RepID=A0A6N1X3T3_9BURK|nr:hydantoinase/carbamoylase family amidase [Comamonas antarctica]QKV54124.1 hydantoinase/carbamoylase family amidase [Comamonas antarctica]
MMACETATDTRALALSLLAEIREATRDGLGVTRESYGKGENTALRILTERAQALDLRCESDRAGNLWLSLPEDERAAPCLVIGSHADSVPQGGNFDGLAGIVAGMLILLGLRGRHEQSQPVRVLALRGEESAWYGKAYLGSLSLLGKLPAATLARPRRDGVDSLGEAMARCGADVGAIERGEALIDTADIAAYLELHIEQGPIMVNRGWPVALVTGIRGNVRHNLVRCIGETGHSGAVPRWLRKDALLAVAELLSRMDEHWRVLLQMGMDMVMTTGICSTSTQSHAVSVIPGEVAFSFEVRSQDTQTLERFYTLMREECAAIERARGVRFEFDDRLFTEPATMDAGWLDRLEAAGEGPKLERIASGAGHDAAVFANAGVPSAMVFIRNENGSHNPHEAMDIDDFVAGVELMQRAMLAG